MAPEALGHHGLQLAPGTANLCEQAAMTAEQLAAALQAAREAGVPERRLAARFWVQRATMLKLIDSAA